MPAETAAHRGIPDATVARLPHYLRALTTLLRRDIDTVSSGELAAAAGVGPAQLRKDLSHLGAHGVRGVGYDATRLAGEISSRLGLARSWPVVVVGAGRLGQSLADHPDLSVGGFAVAALVDRDPALVGRGVHGRVIRDVAELPEIVAGLGRAIGVIATSAQGAQQACDALVDAGVGSILSFAPGVITAPESVQVRRVDVGSELQILAFHAESEAVDAHLARVTSSAPTDPTEPTEPTGPTERVDGVGPAASARPLEGIGS